MSIAHLVRGNSETDWRWSDTGKSARLGRDIGEPVTIDLSNVHDGWKLNPIGLSKLHLPFVDGLPRRTEESFYMVEQKLDGDKPYITVQYVTARR